ncbi:hypothetical protein BD413DRAFT_191696 [Trametes elegans]|nr:hypothetical protein BD413DRAFT_191696 [Trametes elegans]
MPFPMLRPPVARSPSRSRLALRAWCARRTTLPVVPCQTHFVSLPSYEHSTRRQASRRAVIVPSIYDIVALLPVSYYPPPQLLVTIPPHAASRLCSLARSPLHPYIHLPVKVIHPRRRPQWRRGASSSHPPFLRTHVLPSLLRRRPRRVAQRDLVRYCVYHPACRGALCPLLPPPCLTAHCYHLAVITLPGRPALPV